LGLHKSSRILLFGCLLLGGRVYLRAQEIVAEPNLQLFTVLAAINACGYDQADRVLRRIHL